MSISTQTVHFVFNYSAFTYMTGPVFFFFHKRHCSVTPLTFLVPHTIHNMYVQYNMYIQHIEDTFEEIWALSLFPSNQNVLYINHMQSQHSVIILSSLLYNVALVAVIAEKGKNIWTFIESCCLQNASVLVTLFWCVIQMLVLSFVGKEKWMYLGDQLAVFYFF